MARRSILVQLSKCSTLCKSRRFIKKKKPLNSITKGCKISAGLQVNLRFLPSVMVYLLKPC